MKTTILTFTAAYFLCLCSTSAATVTHQRLEVGYSNTLSTTIVPGSTLPPDGLLAVGFNNELLQSATAAFGVANTVNGFCSLAVGSYNQVGNIVSYSSMAVGTANYSLGTNSMVIGEYNHNSADSENGDANASLVTGFFNHNEGNGSLLSGSNNNIPNIIDGQIMDVVENATLLGKGLIVRHDNCTVVGKNNASPVPTIPPSGPSPLFVVGKGSDASNRSNALEVLDNGQIIISVPQGDISMGIYE